MILCSALGCSSSQELTETNDSNNDIPSEQLEIDLPDANELLTNSADSVYTELEDRNLALAENALKMEFQSEANNITHLYVTAQQLFYNGNSEEALILIQQANEVRDNADIKALKGSIYLSLGNREKFEENWRNAFELDATVPIPPIPIIERELQNLGLID